MLDPTHPYKPLDFGNGLVAGSVNSQGRLVSLNTSHPQHGYVTLTCVPPFPDDRWYDPAYVRNYRAALASPKLSGFGFSFPDATSPPTRCSLDADALPHVQLTLDNNITIDLLTFAPYLDGAPAYGALQICTVTNASDQPHELAYTWGGPLALTRSSYAQLTEGGPIPIPPPLYGAPSVGAFPSASASALPSPSASALPSPSASALPSPSASALPSPSASAFPSPSASPPLIIDNTALPSAIAILGLPNGNITYDANTQQLDAHLPGSLHLAPGAKERIVVTFGFGNDAEQAQSHAQALAAFDSTTLLEQTITRWEALSTLVTATDPPDAIWLTRRALVYILACCAVPVGETNCLITDHQLLPLAWTRDAYYAVQALHALREHAAAAGEAAASIRIDLDTLLKQHLAWLFEVAERPDGYWGRAYLTNGRCKDLAFQLDQQCYPLLEIADYVQATGDTTVVERFRAQMQAVLDMILARRSEDAWLFPTSETPADDSVEMPYHLSSQILVWRTFRELAELNTRVAFTTLDLADMAEQVRGDIFQHMVVTRDGESLFCYLVDLHGGYRLYHDANDLPTVLAPQWGFCTAADPVWQATMRFAWSEENRGGFYAGRYAGLGSVHTPHPWPLGAVQELIIARLLGDEARHEAAWRMLTVHACWDGMLPEAYDETTGQVASRHWFAWPGAALAMVTLAES